MSNFILFISFIERKNIDINATISSVSINIFLNFSVPPFIKVEKSDFKIILFYVCQFKNVVAWNLSDFLLRDSFTCFVYTF